MARYSLPHTRVHAPDSTYLALLPTTCLAPALLQCSGPHCCCRQCDGVHIVCGRSEYRFPRGCQHVLGLPRWHVLSYRCLASVQRL